MVAGRGRGRGSRVESRPCVIARRRSRRSNRVACSSTETCWPADDRQDVGDRNCTTQRRGDAEARRGCRATLSSDALHRHEYVVAQQLRSERRSCVEPSAALRLCVEQLPNSAGARRGCRAASSSDALHRHEYVVAQPLRSGRRSCVEPSAALRLCVEQLPNSAGARRGCRAASSSDALHRHEYVVAQPLRSGRRSCVEPSAALDSALSSCPTARRARRNAEGFTKTRKRRPGRGSSVVRGSRVAVRGLSVVGRGSALRAFSSSHDGNATSLTIRRLRT